MIVPRFLATVSMFVVAVSLGLAQTNRERQPDPVSWQLTWEGPGAPGARVLGRLAADIKPGWRVYAPTNPITQVATSVEWIESPAVESVRVFQPQPQVKFDPNFQAESQLYENDAVFLLELTLREAAEPGEAALQVQVRYAACNDRVCLPPKRKLATAALTIAAQGAAVPAAIPPAYSEFAAKTIAEAGAPAAPQQAGAAADSGSRRTTRQADLGQEGLLQFAAVAFGFGLLAIFTPCVFPMIPITMSYFVSTQSGSKKASLRQALTFCLGVVVLFTGIGAAVSAIIGPFGLTQLGSSVWVNLFIAIVFMAFAASLLGAFEITVPSGALTSLSRISSKEGTVGTLVMGLVFALAAFACIGPFLGVLLAGSIQGDLWWPVFGMFVFSIGLVLPFFFLALFPAYLSRLPKSGGWLERTKITMGLLILAASVKYLSNVDQMFQWWILTRERYLAIWIVLFGLAGVYLLGFLRLGHGEGEGPQQQPVGLGRLAVGGLLLVFAVSLVPGMFGGRLGEIDAYVPSPQYSGLAGISPGGATTTNEAAWLKNDYQAALAKARQTGKPILVSFTGYACTNCHWMKANMFTKPEIMEATKNLVLLELYTDGTDAASEANQQLQLNQFGTVAIPYYAIILPDETVASEFEGSTRDVEKFRTFLTARNSKLST